jgi:transcriptional regulator with GAF, ATPase, and Fis domain
MYAAGQKSGNANVWYFACSSCNHTLVNKILSCLTKERFVLEKWSASSSGKPGLIFLDAHSDYEEAISFLQLQVKGKGCRVCVLNLNANLFETEYKIRILRYGADYFFEQAYLCEPYEHVTERLRRWTTIDSLIYSPVIQSRIVSASLGMMETLRAVIEVAFFSTNNVLILGERGVGKEQVARIIHDLDTRKDKGSFVVLDCTTLKKELSGSELFGHERGAFTGAEHGREGAIALAHKGTFFMDEITELPLTLQSEFLRVVQERMYKKVGGNTWKQSEFRLVSATNRDLRKSALDGDFRSDLLDRIETTAIRIPSLDERKDDIPVIVDFYLAKLFGKEIPRVEKEVYEFLSKKNYPGNVRQLKNIVSNIHMRYAGKGPITLGDLPGVDGEYDATSGPGNWYDEPAFLEALKQAIEEGYDLRKIEEIIQSLTTRITLHKVGKNKEASKILGKSERWIQLQKNKK